MALTPNDAEAVAATAGLEAQQHATSPRPKTDNTGWLDIAVLKDSYRRIWAELHPENYLTSPGSENDREKQEPHKQGATKTNIAGRRTRSSIIRYKSWVPQVSILRPGIPRRIETIQCHPSGAWATEKNRERPANRQ